MFAIMFDQDMNISISIALLKSVSKIEHTQLFFLSETSMLLFLVGRNTDTAALNFSQRDLKAAKTRHFGLVSSDTTAQQHDCMQSGSIS